jgi:hypothetical protein
MCVHEQQYCPRCNKAFECKVGNITQCQCYGIILSAEERAYIDSKYNDCICRDCLLEMKNEWVHFKNQFIFQAKIHR